jgi:hypothetical protein
MKCEDVVDGKWYVLKNFTSFSRYAKLPLAVRVQRYTGDYVSVISDDSAFKLIGFSVDEEKRPILDSDAWLLCEASPLIMELL